MYNNNVSSPLPLPACGSGVWDTRDQVLPEWCKGPGGRPLQDSGGQVCRRALQCRRRWVEV